MRLIVRTDAAAVKPLGSRQHLFMNQAAYDLTMFEDERYLSRAHFKHRACGDRLSEIGNVVSDPALDLNNCGMALGA